MNKKWLLSSCLVLFLIAGCAGQGTGKSDNITQEGNTLALYSWEGMFPQEILDGFTEETGIEVEYTVFRNDEEMLREMESSEGKPYDLVIADDYILEAVNEDGLSRPLDKDRISNYGNIDPRFQGLFYDPEDVYTIPWGAGIPSIVYDPASVGFEIRSFSDLWEPSLTKKVALIGNARVIDGFTLMSLGYDMNEESEEALDKTRERLLNLARNVLAVSDYNTQEYLLSKEASAAFLYTSQAMLAKMADPDLVQVFPAEGLGFGTMAMFIPEKSLHPDAAYAFIDYILDGKTAAECFTWLGYYVTDTASAQYLSEEMKEYLVLPEGMNGVPVRNISYKAAYVHKKIWDEFLTACGMN